MIKRILVALDPDPDTPVATEYAVELAGRFDAEVSGLAVVDTREIAAEVGVGGAVGAMYYAEKVRAEVTDKTRATARELIDRFHERLEGARVRHGERVEDGVAYRRIIEDMKYHDLLVIGREPHFFYRRPEQKTGTLAQVVKRGAAPTLVVGPPHRPVRQVLATYDGSDASARTLQKFAQLQPFGTDLAVELIHVRVTGTRRARRASELLLRLMHAFLRAHGFTHVRETSLDGGSPGERLPAYAAQCGADLVVAGAHATSAMRRMAFGSTTHALLEQCTVPLFLFH